MVKFEVLIDSSASLIMTKSIAYRTMTVKTRYFRVVGQEGAGSLWRNLAAVRDIH